MTTAAFVVLDVLVVLAVSRVMRAVLERLHQPAVMAEVCAGLLLGASVLGAVAADAPAALFPADARDVLTVLGQIALAAYLFGVGAGLDRSALRREGRAVGIVAVSAFVVPFTAGALLALALHEHVAGAPPRVPFVLFLGTALAVTALPVLARIVDARSLAARPAGRVALGAAAAQELLVWPLLALPVALAAGDGRSPAVIAAGGALALVGVVTLARILPASRTLLLAGLTTSAAATDLAGLHLVIGAFLFGAALPADRRALALDTLGRRPTRVASALLLPLAFALPALRVDVGSLGEDGLMLFAVVLAVAVLGKLAGAIPAARAGGLDRHEARTVGVLMNARGLVELVVLTVGLDAGLVDERLFAVLVLMALVTTFATGPLVDRSSPADLRCVAC